MLLSAPFPRLSHLYYISFPHPLKARPKLAYHALADEKDAKLAQGGGEQTPIPVSSTFKEIEDKVKHLEATTYKSHRGVSEAPVPGEEYIAKLIS